MIASEIITKFHLYCGDQSELSSDDELDLLNNVYGNVLQDRPWEFLKSNATGAITVSNGVATIPLPENFRIFAENNNYTDNQTEIRNNASPKVVFVGQSYEPYQIVNYSDRRQYRNQAHYCYVDPVLKAIVFTALPSDTSLYDFDYIFQWDDLAIGDTPIFPADFHNILFSLMCVDLEIINLFDKTHSFAVQNQAAADKGMKAMQLYNANLLFN